MPERPNIVLITTDQQRGDCVSRDPQAPAPLQTPNLDWLGRSGAHFLHAYAECPSCIPARRSLMSGMAPAANGMVGFEVAEWNPPHTLAGELSKGGYQTEMIGKAHLFPLRRRFGFDRVQLADATRGPENDYVDWLRERHGRFEVDPGMGHGVSSNGWVGRPPPPARGADAHLLGHRPRHGVPEEAGPVGAVLPQPFLHRSASAADAAGVLLPALHRAGDPGAGCRGLGPAARRAADRGSTRTPGKSVSTSSRCAVRAPPTTAWSTSSTTRSGASSSSPRASTTASSSSPPTTARCLVTTTSSARPGLTRPRRGCRSSCGPPPPGSCPTGSSAHPRSDSRTSCRPCSTPPVWRFPITAPAAACCR